MACSRKPFVTAFFVLAFVAFGMHLTGFVAPGLMVFRVTQEFFVVEEFTEEVDVMQQVQAPVDSSESDSDDEIDYDMPEVPPGQEERMFDRGGVPPPVEDESDAPVDDDEDEDEVDEEIEEELENELYGSQPSPSPRPGPRPGPRPPHHHKHHKHHKHHHGPGEDEEEMVGMFMMESQMEFGEDFESEIRVGLWFSHVCSYTHMIKDSESESSEEDNDKKYKHRCIRVSTKCALSRLEQTAIMGFGKGHHMGGRHLTEHRVEASLALAFIIVGLISAIVACKKAETSRAPLVICALTMLVAVALILVPTARLARCMHHKMREDIPGLSVKAPYALMISGLGGVFGFVAILVAFVGLCVASRKQKGQFYRFHNEDELVDKKQRSKLAFVAEIVPEITPGFGEPEKKPLE